MKIVINSCHGGFGLSRVAETMYMNLKGLNECPHSYDIPRDDSALIKVVEDLGKSASDSFSKLKVVEIPDDVDWIIQEYDGKEWIAERHRTWC